VAKIVFDPEAKKEIKEAAEYYENCQEGLGEKFLGAIERSVENISANPLMYRKLRGNFRRCLVSKFPYGLIYTIAEDEIYVAAAMHLKRNPG
jgi:toxin ParE1/3/4